MVSKLSHPNTVQVFDFGVLRGPHLPGDGVPARRRPRAHRAQGRAARAGALRQDHASRSAARSPRRTTWASSTATSSPRTSSSSAGRAGSDVVKVLDFGLAKLRESAELDDVTSRGAIVGTPYYMSPEQIRGEAVDPRSDIYSLGALMYAAPDRRAGLRRAAARWVSSPSTSPTCPMSPTSRFPHLGIPRGHQRRRDARIGEGSGAALPERTGAAVRARQRAPHRRRHLERRAAPRLRAAARVDANGQKTRRLATR